MEIENVVKQTEWTAEEVGRLDGCCPDCGHDKWYRGPEAGLCVNLKCAGCGSTFNFMGPFGLERIGP